MSVAGKKARGEAVKPPLRVGNLDEFLSIYFSLLLGNVEMGDTTLTPDGRTQTEQVGRVREALKRYMREQRRIFHQELIPELAAAGTSIRPYRDLPPSQQEELRQWFMRDVFPVCTPLAVDPAHPFPFISNLVPLVRIASGPGKESDGRALAAAV